MNGIFFKEIETLHNRMSILYLLGYVWFLRKVIFSPMQNIKQNQI